MHKTRNLAPPVSGRIGYPLGFAAAVVVTVVAVAAHGTGHPLWTLAALAVASAAVSSVTTARAALATGAVAWALYSGFVLGRRGELVFTSVSIVAAAVLCCVVAVAYVVACVVRYARRTVTSLAIPADYGFVLIR